jgi:ABC-type sugar transport system ATPase subunit
MAAVTLDDLSVSLDRRAILDRINVEIPDGAFVAVVGPSGTGKTTVLRAIAGLVRPDSGRVLFNGVDINRVKTADRDVGMVFQAPVLLPLRNVRRNVEFPLEIRKETLDSIRDRVTAEVRALHIEHLLRRNPNELSRGEGQLVQIARTMVRTPQLLLLDEPFAPLDEHLRSRMRAEIRMLQQGYGVTTVMATNDPFDAMSLASMIVVLDGSPARVAQLGTPDEVHDQPVNIDVATSTGPMWTLDVSVGRDGDGVWLSHSDAVRMRSWSPEMVDRSGGEVTLGVRTEGLVRHERGNASAVLERIVPSAAGNLLCRWGGRMVTATGDADHNEVGSSIRLEVVAPVIFDADDGRRIC